MGDVDSSTLGHTQTHEHLFIDRTVSRSQPRELIEGRPEAQITLSSYYRTRREHPSHDLRLSSERDAVEALNEYRLSGGGAIVEATPIGLGRNPEGLRRAAAASGVHVIMGTGYYYRDHHPAHLDLLSVEQITQQIVDDIVVGVGDTGIRSGIIGEIGMSWPHHEVENRVLKAAAWAQQETGAALLIHPGRYPESPFEAIRTVVSAGGDPSRTIMSHIDRTLFDAQEVRRLAETGCVIEFDLFGQESSYYPLGDIDMPNDATRVDLIIDLIDHGFGNQVLAAQDICHKSHLRRYGGEGYTHLIEHVIPLMRRKGMTPAQIHAVTVLSPARLVSLQV
jgi:phosphotriesterase-related protein